MSVTAVLGLNSSTTRYYTGANRLNPYNYSTSFAWCPSAYYLPSRGKYWLPDAATNNVGGEDRVVMQLTTGQMKLDDVKVTLPFNYVCEVYNAIINLQIII